ncbi:hypothetical protein MTO96_050170 [Rhipicephalus appendiculatus]
MPLTRALFCVVQGIFQFSASSATRGYTCWEKTASSTCINFVGIAALARFHCGHFPVQCIFSNERLHVLGKNGIVDVYQLRRDSSAGQIPLWSLPGNLTLLATPIGSRGVTSFGNPTIQETPERFLFCGHEGRCLAMTLTRALFCVVQGIFQFSASSATSGYTCWEKQHRRRVSTLSG